MSTEVTTTRGSVVEKQDWARAMAPSPLLPKAYQGNPANLFLAAEFADALGIERINAITSIHVIEGKPSASADLIAGLVRRAGHKLRVTGNDLTCTAQIVRADDPEFTFEATWTMDKARQAGLANKGVWKNYPGAMLRSRAITEVARAAASDALLGVIYTPEELGADVDGTGAPTRAVHITAATPVSVAEITGEVVAATVEPDAAMPLTDHTRKHMFALLHDLGIDDRDRQIAGISAIIGRQIQSRSELTEDDARAVVIDLEGRRDGAA